MLAALAAIQATLAPLQYSTHLLAAEGPSDKLTAPVPYLVLEVAGPGLIPDELPLCGPQGDLQFILRLKAVSYPADAPVKVLQRARGVLAPGLGSSRIVTADRVIDVAYEGMEVGSRVDTDHRAANLNVHPSWALDAYAVHVQHRA